MKQSQIRFKRYVVDTKDAALNRSSQRNAMFFVAHQWGARRDSDPQLDPPNSNVKMLLFAVFQGQRHPKEIHPRILRNEERKNVEMRATQTKTKSKSYIKHSKLNKRQAAYLLLLNSLKFSTFWCCSVTSWEELGLQQWADSLRLQQEIEA